MKQLERKITITYRWWRNDEKPISSKMKQQLDDKAISHIKDMWKQSYTSGQLIDYSSYKGH